MDSFHLSDQETPSRLYYFHVDHNLAETSVESQAIPFSLIVNSSNDVISALEEVQHSMDEAVQEQFINASNIKNDNKIVGPCTSNEMLNNQYSNNPHNVNKQLDNSSRTKEVAIYQQESKKRKIIKEKKFHEFVHIVDRVVPPRAVAVLPAALYLRRGSVVPRRVLPGRIKFGPVQGIMNMLLKNTIQDKVIKAATSKKPIFLKKMGDFVTYIDVSDQDKSNWFSLLPLGDQNTANVWLNQVDNELFGITVKSILTRVPLALGYSKQYADEYCIPPGQPVLDISRDVDVAVNPHCCSECKRTFATAALFQKHKAVYHKDLRVRKTRRGRFRCRTCNKIFCRLFTLKRHVAFHCCKTTEKDTSNVTEPVLDAESQTNTSLNLEDSRIPSDESLQNFTNGLDFSTSLFDSDRISNLDISGSSRSETVFNPYTNESGVNTDLGYANPEPPKIKTDTAINLQHFSDGSLLSTCPYCKLTVISQKRHLHFRECPARCWKCECGRTYLNKERLAHHIHTRHHIAQKTEEKEVQPETKENEFKCDKCSFSYRRRGMLVNHMWNVHKTDKVTVPLQQRVRHYPCVACPKIYRSASKRDCHVRTHHPGVEKVKGGSIEGGTRAVEPSACPACPRQYVTRAKMLQHLRAVHPDLAPPILKSTKSKTSKLKQDQKEVTDTLETSNAFSYYG